MFISPRSLRLCVVAGAILTGLLLGGCVTAKPSDSKSMVNTTAISVKSHQGAVGVKVTGGTETDSLGASKISNTSFAEAITASIQNSKLFSSVAAAGAPADYLVEVQIVRLDQPVFGGTFTVKLEATWRLLKAADKAVIWERSIESSGTATMSDAFVGVTRLKLANEAAARNNIADAFKQIDSLSF